ncbi:MAG: glycosyl hydrolase [Sedimentisphaerales bacterium]
MNESPSIKSWKFTAVVIGIFCLVIQLPSAALTADIKKDFADPPITYWPRPLWFWNNTEVKVEVLLEQMQKSKNLSKYGGFGILPFGKSFGPEYLGEQYFAVYGAVLAKARELGMTMSLYDEYGFPSGPAGAPNSSNISLFASKFPELTIKRLDKHEETITGPAQYSRNFPQGKIMSVVAMNNATKERVELTKKTKDHRLSWTVPSGTWKIMVFLCVKDGYPSCDYLDPPAVEKFVEITHQAYYDRFREHFGTTIDSTFHDEPTLYRAGGRTWTHMFNEKFEARYGFDPRPYYPALWYDIGPRTAAARNYLFGFRSELYALGFPKVIQDWCDKHEIEATGHQDQEEVINPVSVSGDLMKCFKHQAIPGVDKIGGNRPAERTYKIISSSAYNWDKTLVMSETYGAMGNLSWEAMYAVVMEQYTKGINMLIPHAVWYDDNNVVFKPELSYRSPIYGQSLPEFNTYTARLNVMLQNDGRHISDIALLYPIATLQGSHHLDGPLGFYKGGVTVPEADYMDVGELLIAEAGRDYTFIHPEVLDDNCTLDGNELVLQNRIHHGRFKVFVLPGHKTILWSNLKKIKKFYDGGGRVIATGTLPFKSAEFGHDKDVVRTIEAMFGTKGPGTSADYSLKANAHGGMAIRLNILSGTALRKALDKALDVYDVQFEANKVLRYIHKIKDSRNIYLFANITNMTIDTHAGIRGRMQPEIWDPHTGEISKADCTHEVEAGTDVTVVRITLAPFKSVFIVGGR